MSVAEGGEGWCVCRVTLLQMTQISWANWLLWARGEGKWEWNSFQMQRWTPYPLSSPSLSLRLISLTPIEFNRSRLSISVAHINYLINHKFRNSFKCVCLIFIRGNYQSAEGPEFGGNWMDVGKYWNDLLFGVLFDQYLLQYLLQYREKADNL